MKIWIDGYEANVPQRLGSSQIAFEILKNLEKIDKENEYTILLPSKPLDDLPKERNGWRYKVLKPSKLWTRVALPAALYFTKDKPDLIFSPTHYIPRFSPVKRIALIFDLSFLHFPEMFKQKDLWQLKNWTKFSILSSNHIITISKSTKKDILENYGVEDKKITAIYPGYDKTKFRPIKDTLKIKNICKKYGIDGEYIIFIGTIQPRKNLVRLIEVFGRLLGVLPARYPAVHPRSPSTSLGIAAASRREPLLPVTPRNRSRSYLSLVIVGKTTGPGREGWMFEDILNTPKKLGIEDKVKFSGFVPTEDLPYLLCGAKAYILPSLWEGFGIPVLEAMACGVPVIVSNISSLPEVVGNAGLLVDPYSIDQIEQAIRTVISDKKLREKYSKAGMIQAKKFSWDKMARKILKVFEEENSP